jgi:hypothetical protein
MVVDGDVDGVDVIVTNWDRDVVKVTEPEGLTETVVDNELDEVGEVLLLAVLHDVDEWHAEAVKEAAAVDEPTRDDVGNDVSENEETEEAVAVEDKDGLSEGGDETVATVVIDATNETVELTVADTDVVALDDKQAVDDTEADRDEFDEPDAVVEEDTECEGVVDDVPDTVVLDETLELSVDVAQTVALIDCDVDVVKLDVGVKLVVNDEVTLLEAVDEANAESEK